MSESVPFFKRSRARPTTVRNRRESPPQDSPVASSSSKSEVVLPTRKQATNLLAAGTKRTATERDKDSFDVNWTSGTGSHADAAQDILDGDEAAELLAKRVRPNPDDSSLLDTPDDGKYHGAANYKKHLKKSEDTPKAMRVGPQRSNASTIRTVTMVDYQPDVCKDYKETGFCGFGDTCKFLHDRGTYLQGWQLDKLAENPTKAVEDASSSDSDEDIPFACFICRKPYTDPVVTRCNHFFCSACAIKRFAKTPKCAACGVPTGGIFNRAEKVMGKLREKQKRKEEEEEREKEDAANGKGEGENGIEIASGSEEEDDSDDDD